MSNERDNRSLTPRFFSLHTPALVASFLHPSIFFLKLPNLSTFLFPRYRLFLSYFSQLAPFSLDHCQPDPPAHVNTAPHTYTLVVYRAQSGEHRIHPPTLVSRGSIRGRKSRVDINSFIAALVLHRDTSYFFPLLGFIIQPLLPFFSRRANNKYLRQY